MEERRSELNAPLKRNSMIADFLAIMTNCSLICHYDVAKLTTCWKIPVVYLITVTIILEMGLIGMAVLGWIRRFKHYVGGYRLNVVYPLR